MSIELQVPSLTNRQGVNSEYNSYSIFKLGSIEFSERIGVLRCSSNTNQAGRFSLSMEKRPQPWSMLEISLSENIELWLVTWSYSFESFHPDIDNTSNYGFSTESAAIKDCLYKIKSELPTGGPFHAIPVLED